MPRFLLIALAFSVFGPSQVAALFLSLDTSPSEVRSDLSPAVITLTATLVDAAHQPVPGIDILFSAPLGHLQSAGASQKTDANGQVTDTLTISQSALLNFQWRSLTIRASAPDGHGGMLRAASTLTIRQISSRLGPATGLPAAHVSEPKQFDDFALQQMLLKAEESLGRLELVKSDSITAALGKIQGASVTRTQFGLTGSELATPQVVQTESATPSTLTTTSSVTPSPASAPSPPEFTLPSSFSPSALDTLGEILQVNLEVANLRLLLQGSLTDQVELVGDALIPRTRFTFGFPVTIETPRDSRYRDAAVEVEVRVTVNRPCAPAGSPGIKMVLPREKSYNVAQIRSSTASIGAGLISGVFNLGGNWIRGQSKYFLVRDQDTVAFEGRATNPDEIVFGWRFRPVLGQRIVQPGPRLVFAQLTFPIASGAAVVGTAEVTTRWRKQDRKTGALREYIPGTEDTFGPFPLRILDLSPTTVTMTHLDLGNGKIGTTLRPSQPGLFFEGTSFRLGNASSPVIALASPTDHLHIDMKPADVVRGGLYMGLRGQREREVVNSCNDPGIDAAVPAGCDVLPSIEKARRRRQILKNNSGSSREKVFCPPSDFFDFRITKVEPTPINSTQTRLKITLDRLEDSDAKRQIRFLTLLGDKVFGLRDAPYEEYDPANGVIRLQVDNSVLAKAAYVEVVRYLWGTGYHDLEALPRAARLAVAKHTVISEAGDLVLALEGQALDQAHIHWPTTAEFLELPARQSGYALVKIPAAAMKGLKQLVLHKDQEVPVLVDVSKSTPAPQPVPKPELIQPGPVKIGAQVEVTIAWKNKGEIVAVKYEEVAQTILKGKPNSVRFRLADELTQRPRKLPLVLEFKDKTKLPITLEIVDQYLAIVDQ